VDSELARRREQWTWRGRVTPPFAAIPDDRQESVWDYPRPPGLVCDTREVIIRWHDVEIARTTRALRLLETSHPPSFYLPASDVARHLLVAGTGSSVCEWKGAARYWSLVNERERLVNVAWSYPQPLPDMEPLANYFAFYPANLDCRVAGERVTAQPGGFYGGWITADVVGPFKGAAGSQGW